MQATYPAAAPSPYAERKTSKLGKASLLIAIGVFLCVAASGVLLIVMLQTAGSNKAGLAISVIGWFLAPGAHLVGLVLGIVDVCRANSRKLVPARGIVANALLGGIGLAIWAALGAALLKHGGGVN